MRLIDELYAAAPFFGKLKITEALRRMGHTVNHKRVGRLMGLMGLRAIFPGPRLSTPRKEHRKYPYLLRGLSIVRRNQVWSTDITYIRLRRGFVYLAAIMDWFSRYVVSWALSITLDADFCVDMLHTALKTATPEIFNSDQALGYRTPAEVYFEVNRESFTGGNCLMESTVENSNTMLLRESPQGAPAGQTQGDSHLKLPRILS